ncbi:MAG: hypothetical protein CFE26_11050, partial [Verrucomicrobiales bacterium VVV1]
MSFFDDLITSSKGPGVIGTVMGLVVLSGFVLLYFLVFDASMLGGGIKIEAVIRDQAVEIDGLKERLDIKTKETAVIPERKKILSELEEVTRKTRLDQGTVDGLARVIAKVKTEIVETGKNFETYQQAFHIQIRGEATGTKYPELKTVSGKSYKNVSITRVDAIGMAFTHQDGSSRVDFSDLPADIQEHFQYNSKEKDLARRAEDTVAGQHLEEVETALTKSREEADKEQIAGNEKSEAAVATLRAK